MQYKISQGNIIFNSSDIFLLKEEVIANLKEIASNHPLKRSRVCIHESLENKVHEMIIVAHKEGVIAPHKHPNDKPESYHVLEGELKVLIFDKDGNEVDEFILSHKSHPKMYRIRGGIWHQPIPITEWVVYHEVATGPFDKNQDVIFLGDKNASRNSR